MKSTTKSRESFLQPLSSRVSFLLILATAFILFIGAPLFILTPDQAVHTFDMAKSPLTLSLLGLVFICFVFAIALINKIFVEKHKHLWGSAIVVFIFSWVALAAFLLPLTTAGGMFEAVDGSTNWLNFVLLIAASSVVSVTLLSKNSNVVLVFFAIFIAGSLGQKIPGLTNEFNTKISVDPVLLSKDKNVVVIGLDGIPGHSALRVLEENSELSEAFKDFTFFPNVASSSPSTEASLLGLMLGNDDFTEVIKPSPEVLKQSYFYDETKYDFYTNSLFYDYNLTGTKVAVEPVQDVPRIMRLLEVYKSVMLRLFTNVGAKAVEKIEHMMLQATAGHGQNSTLWFDYMTDRFESGSDRTSVVYMHFEFTHHPVTLDENCVYRSADPVWKAGNQNHRGVINMTQCGMSKLAELLNKLKIADAYDNTLIVFYSDHGKPAGYYTSAPENLRINNNPHWGFDRYRPMLFIKDIGDERVSFDTDNRHILLDDIAKTTCQRMEGQHFCDHINGIDLLGETGEMPKQFFIHLVEDENSTWERDTHIAVQIPRNMPLLEALQKNPTIKLSEKTTSEAPLVGGLE